MTDQLIQRLKAGENGLAIETEVEIALFQPCETYASVTANAAATKLIYVRTDGRNETCWPQDWCADPVETTTLLETLMQQQKAEEERVSRPTAFNQIPFSEGNK